VPACAVKFSTWEDEQGNHKFKASLGCTATPCLKITEGEGKGGRETETDRETGIDMDN
jgi:hypothetical protein